MKWDPKWYRVRIKEENYLAHSGLQKAEITQDSSKAWEFSNEKDAKTWAEYYKLKNYKVEPISYVAGSWLMEEKRKHLHGQTL